MAFLRATEWIQDKSDGTWLFVVKGKDGLSHFVCCNKDLVLSADSDDWLPVAVCAKDSDRNLTLIEFPHGSTEAVNRIWVHDCDILPGETHVNYFPESAVFPVLEVNMKSELTSWEDRITVVNVETTAEAAQLESDRRNRLNSKRGRFYFWQAAKCKK